MITKTKPLQALRAGELMSRDMLVIPVEASLRHAGHMLAQARVSGAPVVDREGRAVGVLSTTDFLRWLDHHNGHPVQSQLCPPPCVCTDWEVVDFQAVPVDEVRTYMTADPVTAAPQATIAELARMMLDAHIHRVIVVDEERRPIGIVTSTDILAAVAYHGTATR